MQRPVLVAGITLVLFAVSLFNVPWNVPSVTGQTVPGGFNVFLPFVARPEHIWTNLGLGQNVMDIAVDTVTPSTLYAAGFAGVYKSTDAGRNWTTISTTGVSRLLID